MTIYELADEYFHQYEILDAKIKGLKPLLCIYSGEDLVKLRKKIKVYYDMALDCRRIGNMLKYYYEED